MTHSGHTTLLHWFSLLSYIAQHYFAVAGLFKSLKLKKFDAWIKFCLYKYNCDQKDLRQRKIPDKTICWCFLTSISQIFFVGQKTSDEGKYFAKCKWLRRWLFVYNRNNVKIWGHCQEFVWHRSLYSILLDTPPSSLYLK